MTERDFVAGALERLGPLAKAARDATAAAGLHREVRQHVVTFFAAALTGPACPGDRSAHPTGRPLGAGR
ncbi:MAG: hypothetical protein ACRDSL_27430 [Pseudonocardiaceae bacterium]